MRQLWDVTTQFPDIPGRIEPNFSLLRLFDILPLLCLLPFSVPSFPLIPRNTFTWILISGLTSRGPNLWQASNPVQKVRKDSWKISHLRWCLVVNQLYGEWVEKKEVIGHPEVSPGEVVIGYKLLSWIHLRFPFWQVLWWAHIFFKLYVNDTKIPASSWSTFIRGILFKTTKQNIFVLFLLMDSLPVSAWIMPWQKWERASPLDFII